MQAKFIVEGDCMHRTVACTEQLQYVVDLLGVPSCTVPTVYSVATWCGDGSQVNPALDRAGGGIGLRGRIAPKAAIAGAAQARNAPAVIICPAKNLVGLSLARQGLAASI